MSFAFVGRTAPKNPIQASDFTFVQRTGLALDERTDHAEGQENHDPRAPTRKRPSPEIRPLNRREKSANRPKIRLSTAKMFRGKSNG
jgi:hypothetical protein